MINVAVQETVEQEPDFRKPRYPGHGREINSGMNQLGTSGPSRMLRMALPLGKTFGTFTDLLKDQFKLLHLF
jgi:hypothetical protein